MSDFAKRVWAKLSSVDCSKHVEEKNGLKFLSWAWAWGMLMEIFPESEYVFGDVAFMNGGSAEVWVTVTIKDGEESLTRTMWLPVMDYRNNAIINPDSRQISDARMRCLVKCLAMFGLGHYLYAGEDVPDKAKHDEAEEARYDALCESLAEEIAAIKDGIRDGKLDVAAAAWFGLDDETKAALWKSPSKGGVFTAREREVMKSKEFRSAWSGNE